MIFFDGVCVGCNKFVDFVMKADSRAEIFFSPLQGETAAKLSLYEHHNSYEWQIVYVDEKGIYEGPDAVLLILRRIGGFWRLPALFIRFPKSVKEYLYGICSRNRYRVFGKMDSCRVPSPEESKRFLP